MSIGINHLEMALKAMIYYIIAFTREKNEFRASIHVIAFQLRHCCRVCNKDDGEELYVKVNFDWLHVEIFPKQ